MICPHCQKEIADSSQFCEFCGKAVSAGTGSPRIVQGTGVIASTATGQSLQSEELKKQMKRAWVALLAVAILQAVAALLLIGLGMGRAGGKDANLLVVVGAVCAVLAAIFFGLAFWARKQPLPAAIAGLVILITLWLVGAVVEPTSLVQGWLIKIIIIIVLVRAIKAGVTHRNLVRQMAASQAAQA